MTRCVRSFPLWAALIGVMLIPLRPAAAQTSLQIPLQFDFINPGARSLALGGAFAGVADDATASFANPAGLTQLGVSELSVEFRHTRVTSPFLQGGRLSGTIVNEGVDTVQGPVFADSVGAHSAIGFFSLVYPHPSHNWVIAAYRHELARIDQTFMSQGVFQQDPAEFTSRREPPQDAVRKVSVTGYGVSGAYQLRRNLALGAGLAVYSFDIDSTFRRFETIGFLGPKNPNAESGRSKQLGSDFGLAPTFGLMANRGRVRAGVTFRLGPSFDYATQEGTAPSRNNAFRVPNTFAVGVSARLTSRVIVAGEVTRITYSRLVKDFVSDQALASEQQANFEIDNGTEIHGGIQYAAARQNGAPIRLRIGTWYDPDHSVRYRPTQVRATPLDRLFDERLTTALSRGQSQVHLSGGVGVTLTRRLEFNAAVDVASRTRLFSTSVIVHLGQEANP